MLIEEGRKFWYDHVLPRKPPEPENEDERAELLALHVSEARSRDADRVNARDGRAGSIASRGS